MRVRGYVDYQYRPPAPFVMASISLEGAGVEGRVAFLIDTGASVTTLLWADVIRLGIDVERLEGRERELTGIGGTVRTKLAPAVIRFTEEGGEEITEEVEVCVVSSPCPDERLLLLPSLLGRDIINRYELAYDIARERVLLVKHPSSSGSSSP